MGTERGPHAELVKSFIPSFMLANNLIPLVAGQDREFTELVFQIGGREVDLGTPGADCADGMQA